jgi:hypothetical protein
MYSKLSMLRVGKGGDTILRHDHRMKGTKEKKVQKKNFRGIPGRKK